MNAAVLVTTLRLGAAVHVTKGPAKNSYIVNVAGGKFDASAGSIVKAMAASKYNTWPKLSMSVGAKRSVREYAGKWGGPARGLVALEVSLLREQIGLWVRPSFTISGRLICKNPNFSHPPRSAFTNVDYSAIEKRVLANYQSILILEAP